MLFVYWYFILFLTSIGHISMLMCHTEKNTMSIDKSIFVNVSYALRLLTDHLSFFGEGGGGRGWRKGLLVISNKRNIFYFFEMQSSTCWCCRLWSFGDFFRCSTFDFQQTFRQVLADLLHRKTACNLLTFEKWLKERKQSVTAEGIYLSLNCSMLVYYN